MRYEEIGSPIAEEELATIRHYVAQCKKRELFALGRREREGIVYLARLLSEVDRLCIYREGMDRRRT
jgi:hypothetical protein